jgi:predicted dithiol-disulfide oxidoreductase (DUF899 family)
MKELEQAYMEFVKAKERLKELQKGLPKETFEDFALKDWEGREVRLSELFGDRQDLLVVHNMGSSCPYCTMWADGFNGVLPHLENRAAFAVVSPNSPESQKKFAQGRGWEFRMLSAEGSEFTRRAGYETEESGALPGVSAFRKDDDGTIRRVGHSPFGPGDDYCGVWHLFDLFEEGAGGWEPKFKY